MSIVRRLVKLLQIELDIQSHLGKGSTLDLRLPQGTASVPAGETRTAFSVMPEPNGGDVRGILLLEDDPGVRNATRMLLKAEGYTVTTASCGEQALRRACEDTWPDLLVTDVHLGPEESGTQLITRLRAAHSASLEAIPITGGTSSAIKDLTRDPHLRVLSKPVRADDFLGLVRELLTG